MNCSINVIELKRYLERNRIMKKIYIILTVILIAASSFAMYSGDTPSRAENFKLKDYNGKEYQLSEFKDSKAVVLMFISTQCPVSNSYNEKMAKLYNDYEKKGIVFLGVNSNQAESVEEIKKHSKENKFGFPVLKDVNNLVADKLSASVTPEIYVLNNKLDVLYHGRIDDSRREDEVKSSDLRNALDEILSGQNVKVPKTKAFGCSIKRIDK